MQSVEDHEAKVATFGGPPDSPERELMVHIISQAKDDLYGANEGRFEKNALAWLTTKDGDPISKGRPWFYSFESICEQLDLDVDTIRRGILARYEEQ